MVRIASSATASRYAAQLNALPTTAELEDRLGKCRQELRDIVDQSVRAPAANEAGATATTTTTATGSIQELVVARADLAVVYAGIQRDIDVVGDEIQRLRVCVEALQARTTGTGEGDEGHGFDDDDVEEFERVRDMISAAQTALADLQRRQDEVFGRIATLQTMMTRQMRQESSFERGRIRRMLVRVRASDARHDDDD